MFSGTVCALALCAALGAAVWRRSRIRSADAVISLGLSGLAALSAWANSYSEDAVIRVFILMASGLGGFWCSRILLTSQRRQTVFAWMCLGSLVGVMALSLRNFPVTGTVDYFLYSRSHPLIQMLFLLSFGPIALLSRRAPVRSALAVAALVSMYVSLYLIGVDDTRSAVLIPLAILALLAVLVSFGSRLVPAAFVMLLLVSAITAHYATNISNRGLMQYQEYRIESYPFSWHVTEKHPWLGIGLRTPRESYLSDYSTSNPEYPDHQFRAEVQYLVTSENVFLTLMVGLGLPFLVLYGVALIAMLFRLVRMVFRPPDEPFFNPLALLLPLMASLLHALTTDVLLYPQINWFFHVMLGLIPYRPRYSDDAALGWKAVAARAAAALAVATLGVFVGTHQAFRPEGLSGSDPSIQSKPALTSSARSARTGGTDYSAARGAGADRSVVTASPNQKDGGNVISGSNTPYTGPSGTLVVTIDDYVGSPANWELMLIVDNSESMAHEEPSWQPSRWRAALDFAQRLTTILPDKAKAAVRDFSSEFSGRKGGREVPLRLSRLLCSWDEAPFTELVRVTSYAVPAGRNNLCAAAMNSLRSDFQPSDDCSGRIVMVTDGQGACAWEPLVRAASSDHRRGAVKVDVIAVGMAEANRQSYAGLAEKTGGAFVQVRGPSELDSALNLYCHTLELNRPAPLELRGSRGVFKVLPGEKIKLPAGQYSALLPRMPGLGAYNRKVTEAIRVNPGESATVRIRLENGAPVLQ